MTDELPGAVLAATELLRALADEDARPDQAMARLGALRAAYPALGVDLLWEEETYDASVHYDLLLTRAGEGTISMSYCAERALPWPMRGVHRWREGDLVRVNETFLTVDRAVATIDFIWDQAPIVERLINACLIDQELARRPIELTDEEHQRAMDAFRRAHRLYQADETHRWMERRGLSMEALEKLVAGEALVARLRERVAAGQVEAYFEEHRADLDAARIARFAVADMEGGVQIATAIRERQLDFYVAAERQALAGDDATSGGGLFEIVRRGEASPALAKAVFVAEIGAVVGPVATDEGFTIARVLDLVPARLDGPTRLAVERRLFAAWLEERRRTARIEWFWGNAAQTTPAA
jgi:putative peptide maturation system protein